MSNKKTIVQILRAPIGGIRKHVVDIITSLENENCEQVFITNTNDTDFDLAILEKIKNLKILHVEIYDRPGFKDLINIIKIYRLLNSYNNLVIHGHGAKGGLYSRIVAKLLRGRSIYTPHGGSLHRVFGPLKNAIYDLVERFLVFFTDEFIFESKYTADTFINNISKTKKYKINYNGIEFSEEPKNTIYHAGEEIKMASFGLLRELKGHSIMIKACKKLKDQNIKFSYDIYGTGELESELLKQIHDLNLKDNVNLVGYSDHVAFDMKKYDLIVQPSLFESFGYVPVEAMALRIPVLVSSNGGLNEVVPNSKIGFKAKSNEPDEYFQIIQQIYNGKEDLQLKVENAYNFAKENFSKAKMIKNLKEYYGI